MQHDQQTHFIGGIEDADYFEVNNRSWGEFYELPRLAAVPGFVHHLFPVPRVDGTLDVVTVGPIVNIPQKQPEK